MTDIKVKDRDVVVPGELLVDGMDSLPGSGTYRKENGIYAERLGLVLLDGRTVKIIPLSGQYVPKRNDKIICTVTNINMSGWTVDTHSAYHAMLSLREATSDFIAKGADLSKYFGIGDHLVCTVINVTSQMLIDVTMKGPGLMKLKGGRTFEVASQKVPRIIGKQGSMVSMLKNATKCNIVVGQNGFVWVHGTPENEIIVRQAIKKIETESNKPGLTDTIKTFLEKATGTKIQDAVQKTN